jgi:hypothetical protein
MVYDGPAPMQRTLPSIRKIYCLIINSKSERATGRKEHTDTGAFL